MFADTISDIQKDLIEGKYTVASLVEHYLINAEISDRNAFVHIYRDSAMAIARQQDKDIADKKPMGKLFGCVISIKDNLCYKDHPVSAGSGILEGYVSPYSATAIEKLLSEGAIIIGSTNCDEFGMGSTSTNSHYGPVKNGIDPTRIAGGSSGGAAVSVQQNACLLALGSDTGGSVRQPAAFNEVLGFKPGYGAISRYGLLAYASSFDQIGILGKNVDDISTLFDIMRGKDTKDSTSVNIKGKLSSQKQWKLAYVPEMFDAESVYLQECLQAVMHLENCTSNAVGFDLMPYLVPTYYILTTAEASSNLSRYDGVRYGYRSRNSSDLESMYTQSRTEGFGSEVKKRIMLGTFVLSEGYFDAYFTKALKVRRLMRDSIHKILEDHDALVLPVTTSKAWKLDEKIEDPVQIYLSDVYTVLANLVGMPAISVPIKVKNSDIKSNISLQFIVRKEDDFQAFNLVSNI